MKLSSELIQGFALGESALRARLEEVTRDAVLAEDEAWMGPDRSIKSRFLKLLEQYPELTRPQAYAQAVLELGDRVIAEAVKRMEADDYQASLD